MTPRAQSGPVEETLPAAARAVREFWRRIGRREWAGAEALCAPGLVTIWWASGERFAGAAAFIATQAAYPEGWEITVVEINRLADGRVHSIVRVVHGEARFFANSFFRFSGGRIAAIEEYWSTVEAPPAWRGHLPGVTQLPPDARGEPAAAGP